MAAMMLATPVMNICSPLYAVALSHSAWLEE